MGKEEMQMQHLVDVLHPLPDVILEPELNVLLGKVGPGVLKALDLVGLGREALDEEFLAPDLLGHSEGAGEGPEAGQEVLLDLVGQGLALVRDAVGVEDGDKDHGDDPLDVPEDVLAGSALNHPRHDVPLEGLLPQGPPGGQPEEVCGGPHQQVLHPVRHEENSLGGRLLSSASLGRGALS